MWEQLKTGAPILCGTLASLDCTLDQIINVGTHSLFVGHVTAISTGAASSGLVYFDRKFVKVDMHP